MSDSNNEGKIAELQAELRYERAWVAYYEHVTRDCGPQDDPRALELWETVESTWKERAALLEQPGSKTTVQTCDGGEP